MLSLHSLPPSVAGNQINKPMNVKNSTTNNGYGHTYAKSLPGCLLSQIPRSKSIYFNNVANIVCLFWFNEIEVLDSALEIAENTCAYPFRIASTNGTSSGIVPPSRSHLSPSSFSSLHQSNGSFVLTPGTSPNHTPGHTPPGVRANVAINNFYNNYRSQTCGYSDCYVKPDQQINMNNGGACNVKPQIFSSYSVPTTSFKQFVFSVITETQLPPTAVSLALLYILRLKHRSPIAIHASPNSEYRVFCVALILANKFLDDNTYTNKTWSEITHLALREISQMEIEFLINMNHSLAVSQNEWVSWQSQLKSWLNIYYHGRDSVSIAPRSHIPASLPSPVNSNNYLPASFSNPGYNPVVASLASPPRSTKRKAMVADYPSKKRMLFPSVAAMTTTSSSNSNSNFATNATVQSVNSFNNSMAPNYANIGPVAPPPPLLSPTVNAPQQILLPKVSQGNLNLPHLTDAKVDQAYYSPNTDGTFIPSGNAFSARTSVTTTPGVGVPTMALTGVPSSGVSMNSMSSVNSLKSINTPSDALPVHSRNATMTSQAPPNGGRLMLMRTPPGSLLSNNFPMSNDLANHSLQFRVLNQQKALSTPQIGHVPPQGTAGLQFELEHYVPYQQYPAVYQFSSPTTVTVSYWRDPQLINSSGIN